MLVAVSVLAISLSVFIYHYPVSTWPSLFLHAGAAAPQSPPATQQTQQTPDEQRRIELENQIAHEAKGNSTPEESPQSTPKATAQDSKDAPAVPTFTLDAHQSSDEDDDEEDNLPPPSFPALNSAQRASAPSPNPMAPPPKPTLMAPPSKPASLMPPPRVSPSALRALPNNNTTRIPTTGPLPNRGPPTSNSLALPQSSSSLQPKTPNPRGKVLLSPGHSPLDWATLQKSGKNLSGVPSLVRVTPSMLKTQNGRKGKPAWSSYQGKVYNISPYLPFHPGGEGELRRAAGKDGTRLFMEVHPWVNWENMLGECLVGVMVSEEVGTGVGGNGGSLEDMD